MTGITETMVLVDVPRTTPTLGTALRTEGPLGADLVLPVALHLAVELDALHRLDRLHLGVCPDAVLLEAQARLTEAPAVPSLPHLAPEQRHGGELGPWTDSFGLGATLHHAITGEVPFPDDGLSCPAPLPPSCPPRLAELVFALLDRRPGERPAPSVVVRRVRLLRP